MAQKRCDEEVVRDTFRSFKHELRKRLPIHTLPSTLESKEIISEEERSLIIGSSNVSVQQRDKLVEILLTKDGSAILKVLELLKNHERGYADLVDRIYANMDAVQEKRSAKTPVVPVPANGIPGMKPAPEVKAQRTEQRKEWRVEQDETAPMLRQPMKDEAAIRDTSKVWPQERCDSLDATDGASICDTSKEQPQDRCDSLDATMTESHEKLKHTMKSCPGLEQVLPSFHSLYEKVMLENASLKAQVKKYEERIEQVTKANSVLQGEFERKCEEARMNEELYLVAESRRYELVSQINDLMTNGVEAKSESGREACKRMQETLNKEALETMFQVIIKDFQRKLHELKRENIEMRCQMPEARVLVSKKESAAYGQGVDEQENGHSEIASNELTNHALVAEDKDATPVQDASKEPAVISPKPVVLPKPKLSMVAASKRLTTQNSSATAVATPNTPAIDSSRESHQAAAGKTLTDKGDRHIHDIESSKQPGDRVIEAPDTKSCVGKAESIKCGGKQAPAVVPRRAPARHTEENVKEVTTEDLPKCERCGQVFPWEKLHLRWKHKCKLPPRTRCKSSTLDTNGMPATVPMTVAEELSSSVHEQHFKIETDCAPQVCPCGLAFDNGREYIKHVLTCSKGTPLTPRH